jgi:hypothetical protein
MINIPTAVVAEFARTVAQSTIVQSAAGTVLGICIYTGAAAAGNRITPMIGRAWRNFRATAPTIEGKAEAAAA